MRQQLRLRVLLPIAVLGLLGAGVGAYAFGQGPAPGASSLPLPGATTTGPAPGGAEVPPRQWAKAANAFCAEFEEAAESIQEPRLPEHFEPYFEAMLRVVEQYEPKFAALGWPRGKQAEVVALRTTYAQLTQVLHRGVTAVQTADSVGFEKAFKRFGALGDRWTKRVVALGAAKCADDPEPKPKPKPKPKPDAKPKPKPKPQAPAVSLAALKLVLLTEPAAVVVFYTPDVLLDALAVLEARAAALDAGAAFVAVDVTKEKQVAELAREYLVLDAPTVLVFTKGPTLHTRLDGYADRETILQAVVNALA